MSGKNYYNNSFSLFFVYMFVGCLINMTGQNQKTN